MSCSICPKVLNLCAVLCLDLKPSACHIFLLCQASKEHLQYELVCHLYSEHFKKQLVKSNFLVILIKEKDIAVSTLISCPNCPNCLHEVFYKSIEFHPNLSSLNFVEHFN